MLQQKKVSELDFSCILKPETLACLDRWSQLGNEDEFVAKVFFTLREMYTVVRGRLNHSTTTKDTFVATPQYKGA